MLRWVAPRKGGGTPRVCDLSAELVEKRMTQHFPEGHRGIFQGFCLGRVSQGCGDPGAEGAELQEERGNRRSSERVLEGLNRTGLD